MCHYFSISNEASVVTVTFAPDSLNTGGRLEDEDKERARLPLTTRRSAKVIVRGILAIAASRVSLMARDYFPAGKKSGQKFSERAG